MKESLSSGNQLLPAIFFKELSIKAIKITGF